MKQGKKPSWYVPTGYVPTAGEIEMRRLQLVWLELSDEELLQGLRRCGEQCEAAARDDYPAYTVRAARATYAAYNRLCRERGLVPEGGAA